MGYQEPFGASSALASRTAKAVAHGVVGGAQAAVNGGKFLRGFASSFFTKQVSGRISGSFQGNNVGGAVAAAVVGGTAAVIGGGKFANGAYTTAFQYLFNESQTMEEYYEYLESQRTSISVVSNGKIIRLEGNALELYRVSPGDAICSQGGACPAGSPELRRSQETKYRRDLTTELSSIANKASAGFMIPKFIANPKGTMIDFGTDQATGFFTPDPIEVIIRSYIDYDRGPNDGRIR